MNLGEQLYELRHSVLRDRSDLIAGDSDSLWTDESLVQYIGDAERRFARQVLFLRDATTPEVVQVKLKNGVRDYPLHCSVISVMSARFDNDTYDIQRSGHGLILQYSPPEFLSLDPSAAYVIPPGRPTAYFTDETMVYARSNKVTLGLYPVPGPDEDGKYLRLRVIRLPLTTYSMENLDCESEILVDYQYDVLEWAAYRAQRGWDGDAGAPVTADQHKARFDEAVREATREYKRRMFGNMVFRAGTGGFSWTR